MYGKDDYLLEFGDLLLGEHGEDIGASALGLAAATRRLPLTASGGRRGRGLFSWRVFFRLLLLDLLFFVRLMNK